MTKNEFELLYARQSGVTVEELRIRGQVAVECICGEPGCRGWRMMHKDNVDSFLARQQAQFGKLK